MRNVKTSFILSLSLSMLCLMTGFYLAGLWIVSLITLGLAFAWFSTSKNGTMDGFNLLFLVFIGLSIVGCALGLNFWLMIVSVCLSLAAWDLQLFHHSLIGSSHGAGFQLYLRDHFLSLAAVLIGSLFMIAIGSQVKISISFWAMFFLIILTLFGLEKMRSNIKKIQ